VVCPLRFHFAPRFLHFGASPSFPGRRPRNLASAGPHRAALPGAFPMSLLVFFGVLTFSVATAVVAILSDY
jgi:hypothetical protein